MLESSDSSRFTWSDVFETYHGIEAPKPHLEFVDQLIDLLLADPRFNIVVLPDALEKQIYRSVIYLLLETLMSLVWHLNGLKFLHHEIELELIYDNIPISISNLETVDVTAIEKLVDELLKDNEMNIAWLPDSIEKSLYVTVLFLIFTVIEVVASSIEVTLIGHALKLSFGPNGEGFQKLHEKFKATLRNASSSGSRSQAWRSTVAAETPAERAHLINEMVDKAMNRSKTDPTLQGQQQGQGLSFIPQVAEKALYVTIYSMILCVVEEVFDSTSIRLLGDIILLKLVPASDDDSDNKIIAKKDEIRFDNSIAQSSGYSGWYVSGAFILGFMLNFVCVAYFFEKLVLLYCP